MKHKKRFRNLLLISAISLLAVLTTCTIRTNQNITQQESYDPESIAPGDFYDIDGHTIHVRVFGSGKNTGQDVPLLMLHGFGPGGSSVWAAFAEQQLASQRMVILPDFLGMGYSERVLQPGFHYTIEGQARMIAGLLDAMNIAQVDLLGHSYGGAVSAQFALDYPEKVRRLVLLDAQIYENRLGDFFRSLGGLPFGLGRAVTWSSLGGGSSIYTEFCQEETTCEITAVVHIRGTVDALLAINDTAQVTRLPGDLGQISMPVSVIWGSEDEIVSADDGHRLAGELGVGLVLIEGSSHTPFLDAPEQTAERILKFFSQP